MWVGWVGAHGFKTCLPSDNKDGQGEVDLRGVSGYAVSLGGGGTQTNRLVFHIGAGKQLRSDFKG